MSKKKEYALKEVLLHFPKKISKDIDDYSTNEVFVDSRYVFTRRQGKQQYGYCTHCKSEYKTTGYKHNKEVVCPECGSKCIVKSSGMGRKYLVDEAYFVYYEKSVIDPHILTARCWYAVRDYRNDYRNVETKYAIKALYVFEMGNSYSMKRYACYSYRESECSVGQWHNCSKVYSEYNQTYSYKLRLYCSYKSIEEAVTGTQFQYSTLEEYLRGDMVEFFSLYSKHPCIEYFTKLGYSSLVTDKLHGHSTYRAVNWKGKDLLSILKLTKAEFKEIKANNIDITYEFLDFYKKVKSEGWGMSVSETSRLYLSYGNTCINGLKELLKYSDLKTLLSYFKKQHMKYKDKIRSESRALSIWKDYLADCRTLCMDLSKERNLFPKNLYEAHQDTIKRIVTKEDKLIDKKIKARQASLKKYCYSNDGLLIRPAANTKELIQEGKELDICVGNYENGYVADYANGDNILMFIRKVAEPDTSFYTVEIVDNEIEQVAGYDNEEPTEEIEAFIDKYIEHVLYKIKKASKENTKKSA